ncbi:DUF805 domain-containing protein [Sphingomicrobium aestuariivivum]|uniref:DUF805 domain-containing protein n=1 Tax=Sphingomicrobium aestuariivivum TaxID=1582356 RepID=UPI001FD65355|nr:DUF805 domain-containing protein [Sphingomicrobium aestuariivivum]MCJ8190702.1 DUF805 domain-containing protein [Sphingomicrobium aestuariivivum]
MLRFLWGDWSDGRVKRKPYVMGFAFTILAIFAVVLLMGFAAGGLQSIYGDWPDDFSDIERKGIGLAAFLGFLGSMLLIGLAQLNLVVKRARDTGTSGLIVGFLFILFLATGVGFLIALVLAFIPTGQFASTATGGPTHEP